MSFWPSRREVLGAGFSLAVLPTLGFARRSPSSFGFHYFSDTHVSLNRNIEENRAMLREMATAPQSFAINGGDITDYGWAGEYENYTALKKEVSFPIYEIPGNHDVRWSPLGMKAFSEPLGPPTRVIFHEGVAIALLDSTVPLSHYGHFEAKQLVWLRGELEKVEPGTPIILATHHWVGRDSIMIDNEAELLDVLDELNVKLILTGHGHSDLDWDCDGIACTMNKGLYQGSYQRVEIDHAASMIRLFRRTNETPTMTLVREIKLAPERAKRPFWPVIGQDGEVMRVRTKASNRPTHYRWNQSKWTPFPADSGLAMPPTRGQQRLTIRKGDTGRWSISDFPLEREGILGAKWKVKLSGGVMSHLVLDDRLYVSTMGGSLVAMEAETGNQVWEAKGLGYAHSSPVLSPNDVFVGRSDGSLTCVKRSNGHMRWSAKTGGPVYATSVVAGDLVVLASGDGSVRALEIASGREVWRYDLPKSDTAFVQSMLRAADGKIVFGAWDKCVYALDQHTGKLLWRVPATEKSFAYSSAIGSVVVDGRHVLGVANSNSLFCLELGTGKTVWTATADGDKFGYSGPAVDAKRGLIVAGCLGDTGQVRAVDRATGEERWMCKVGLTVYDSSPALNSKYAAIGSVDSTLNLIDLDQGQLVDQLRLAPGHFLSSPAMNEKLLFAATYSNVVECYAFPS